MFEIGERLSNNLDKVMFMPMESGVMGVSNVPKQGVSASELPINLNIPNTAGSLKPDATTQEKQLALSNLAALSPDNATNIPQASKPPVVINPVNLPSITNIDVSPRVPDNINQLVSPENLPAINQVPNINEVNSLDELSEAFLKEVAGVDLGNTNDIISGQAVDLIQKNNLAILNSQELNQQVAENVKQESVKQAKNAIGFLKGLGESIKKGFSKLDQKNIGLKEVIGAFLLAGGLTAGVIATLPLLPVIAAASGGTIAGTLASYGAFNVAGGVAASVLGPQLALTMTPVALSVASAAGIGLSSAIGAAGLNMVRNKPKEIVTQPESTAIETITNSEPVDLSGNQAENIDNAAEPILVDQIGFESVEKEPNNLDIQSLPAGTKIEVKIVDNGGRLATGILEIVELDNGSKVIKQKDSLANIKSIDSEGKITNNKIIEGQSLQFTYLTPPGDSTVPVKVESFIVLREPELKPGEDKIDNIEVKENLEVGILQQKINDYDKVIEPVKSKLNELNKGIQLLKDRGLSELALTLIDQRKDLLKDSANEESAVIKSILPLAREIKKAELITESNRTPEQQKLVKISQDLQDKDFLVVCNNPESNTSRIMIKGPKDGTFVDRTLSEDQSVIAEEKADQEIEEKVEIKNTAESELDIESGKLNLKGLVSNSNEIKSIIDQDDILGLGYDADNILNELSNILGDEVSLRDIFGYDSLGKIEDLVKTSLLFANINDFGTDNENLKFIKGTSQSFPDAISQNSKLEFLKDYRGPQYNNIQLMIENLALAKEFINLQTTLGKIENSKPFNYESDQDFRLRLAVDVFDKQSSDMNSSILEVMAAADPNLQNVHSSQIKELYVGKVQSNLSAEQRKSISKIPGFFIKIMKGESLEPQKDTTDQEIKSKISDSINNPGDVISIDLGEGELDYQFENINFDDETIAVKTGTGEEIQIAFNQVRSFNNKTAQKNAGEANKQQ